VEGTIMERKDAEWLEKLFIQYKEDQILIAEKLAEGTRLYFDAKFNALEDQISGVKESVEDVEVTLISDLEDLECELKDLEKKTTKKVIAGTVAAIIITLSLWTIFGTDALAVILKLISGVSLP
jgi:hypothetical protein